MKTFLYKNAIYIALIFFIIIPYVLHAGEYLVGGDLGFFEDSIGVNLDRQFYLWSDHLGSGGFSAGRYGNILFYTIVYGLSFLFDSVGVQVFLKIVFYSFAYFGVRLILKEISYGFGYKYNVFLASVVALFYCINLITFDFVRSWLHLYYIFLLITPLLLGIGLRYIRVGQKKYLITFFFLLLINMPIFVNVSYPPIQFLTLFLFFLAVNYKEWKRIIMLLLLYVFINIPSLVEQILLLINVRDLFISSDFNKALLTDYIVTQKKYFSLEYLLSFISGRLFSKHWSYSGIVDQFNYKGIYSSLVFRVISFIPILIIAYAALRKIFFKKAIGSRIFIIFLVSIPLVAMHGFYPLDSVFGYLFENISYMTAWRNSLKFSLILLIAASCLIYIAIQSNRILARIFIGYIVVLSMYGFLGGFINYFSLGSEPKNYQNIDLALDEIGVKDGDRCMIYPTSDKIWFGYNFKYYGFSPFLSTQNRLSCFSKTSELASLANKNIYTLLKDASAVPVDNWRRFHIKYIVFHKDINYEIFNQNDDSDETEKYLKENFNKVFGNENFDIYKTYDENLPLISVSNVDNAVFDYSKFTFAKRSPVSYLLRLEHIDGKKSIHFNESYTPAWRLYLVKNNDEKSDSSYNNFFLFGLGSIFNSSHYEDGNFMNKWIVDSSYIKQNFSKRYYKENLDGSIDLEMVLYYKPQLYWYLSIVVSVITLIVGVLCLFIPRHKNIKRDGQ